MPTWSDIDPATADFTKENMLIPYKGGISKQFLQKLANNTGYNLQFGHHIYINNVVFNNNQEIDFHTGRDYVNRTVMTVIFEIDGLLNSHPIPFKMLIPGGNYDMTWGLMTLTTAYQTGFPANAWEAKALSTGGFRVKSLAGVNGFILRMFVIQMESVFV